MLSVFRASAGSGKTFRLTGDYLRTLLGEKDPVTGRWRLSRQRSRHRHTLAITFTNKATEEMKRRIVHQLAVLASLEPGWIGESPYLETLVGQFGCTREALQKAAAGALRSLLLEFNRFNVSTIDSFFQTVLRAFAREAELTGNYELELDNQAVIRSSVSQVLQSLKTEDDPKANRQLVEWLTQMMSYKIDNGFSFDIFNRSNAMFADLVKFIKSVTGEDFNQLRDRFVEYFSNPERLSRFSRRVGENYRRLHTDMMASSRAVVDYLGGDTRGLSVNAVNVFKNAASDKIHDKPTKTLLSIIESTANAFKKNCDCGDAALHALMAKAAADIYQCLSYGKLFSQIHDNTFSLGLLHRVLAATDEQLSSDNRLMLSDTNYILSRIIADGDAPFVYERVGIDLRHFLIDEFQDTSRLQWHNLRILVEEGLSQGYDSLVIGDEKQCIYRFRNSDPNLLATQLAIDLGQHIPGPGEGADGVKNTNWRSSPVVVEFNNTLFAELARRLGFSSTYANVGQDVPSKNVGRPGYVSVTVKSGDDWQLDNMLDHIYRQLDSGYRPCDITVLVRTAAHGQKVIDYLKRAGNLNPTAPQMRVVSDDADTLESSPSVRLVISMLRVLATGSAEAGAAKSHSVTRRHLTLMINEFERMLNDRATRAEALASIVERYDEIIGADGAHEADHRVFELPQMRCANLISTVEAVIAATVGGSVAMDRENVYLSALQDAVLDFNRRGRADLISFVKWWDQGGRWLKVSLPPDEGAIRVMTIHKSKGLEFRCVHIPFASWPMFKSDGLAWFDISSVPGLAGADTPPAFPLKPFRDMELTVLSEPFRKIRAESMLDELNVAYVGFTRAVDELVVCVNPSTKYEGLGLYIAESLDIDPKDGGVVECGAPTQAVAEQTGRQSALDAHVPLSMPRYATHRHEHLWDSTKLDEDDNISEQRRRGLSLHRMLSRIASLADIALAVERCVTEGTLGRDEADAYAARLRSMIETHGVVRWYEGYERVLCEREIITRRGLTVRPDRVVWLPDGSVEVIDYKTGEIDDARYSRQARIYMSVLHSLGCRIVRGYIWYLDHGRIIEVQPEKGTKKG